MDNNNSISVLNDLIEINKDSQEGFKTAADNVEAGNLKSLFMDMSNERASLATELQGLVRQIGGDAEKTGSVAGTLHRTWLSVKGTFTGSDEEGTLNTAESGEDAIKKAYEDALKEDLEPNVRSVVEAQYTKVKAGHDKIRDLRDATRAANENK